MREIKFRAWDKKNRIMVSVDELHFPQGGIMVFDGCCSRGWEGKDFELMQFTGLRDSKRTAEYPEGQEIYEGDIVRDISESIYSREPNIFIGSIDWDDVNLTYRIQRKNGNFIYLCEADDYEVVGNIHDNPTLLEGQPDAE